MDLLTSLTAGTVGAVGSLTAAASGGFFSTFVSDMKEMMAADQYMAILLDWRILVVVGLLVALGLYSKSKPILLFIFAMYGLTATYHFSMAQDTGGAEMTSSVDNIVIFVVGLGATAVTIIYFVFIRGGLVVRPARLSTRSHVRSRPPHRHHLNDPGGGRPRRGARPR